MYRQLFDAESGTYTYLLAFDRYAVLIDPVLEQVERDLRLLYELELKLLTCLETHVHADHVTGAGELRAQTGCKTVVPDGAKMSCADWALRDGQLFRLGQIELEAITTPGHTNHHMAYYWPQQKRVFTGDALLIRGCGRTDFQNGDAGQLYDSVTERLFSLPDDTRVHPAHDYHGQTASTIGEEKRWNPRFVQLQQSGHHLRSRSDFIDLMGHLKLGLPKKMMEAIPANEHCGQMILADAA